MTELQSRLCIDSVENIFNGNTLRLVLGDHFLQPQEYLVQLCRKWLTRRHPDSACVNEAQLRRAPVYDAEAGDLAAAINSKYDHVLLTAAFHGCIVFFLHELRVRSSRCRLGFTRQISRISILVENLAQHLSRDSRKFLKRAHEL